MKIRIKKKKEVIDEMASVSGGAMQGYGAPFGDPDGNDTFNKKQEQEQRLKGDKLAEMYSTQGLAGKNAQQLVDGEDQYEGYYTRSKQQGLKNVFDQQELKESRSYRLKILQNR
jgi:hypothetical protein